MATNGVGFSESLVHAPQVRTAKYAYRTGTGMMPSAEWLVVHDDFTRSVTTNLPVGWTAAIIDTGATLVADTTATHGTGVLLFDSDGATEGTAVYGTKTIQLTSGKKFWMEMRFKTEIADDSDVQFGLTAVTATSNPEDLWTTTATDLVAFGVLDGDATVTMLADKSNSGSTAELGTIDLVSATWHTLAIGYDGVKLRGYVDGELALTWAQAAATIPTGVALAPFFGFRNGSAATTEGHIDYIRYALER
jgi:hypothetical protein